jgi:alanine racemase
MGYSLPENAHLLDTKRCDFVVQDIAGLHAFGLLGKPVRVHVELDTGFNRLGLNEQELAPYLAVLKQYPKLVLDGVMSHLADADNELDDDYTVRQVRAFDAQVEQVMASGFSPKYIHLAQTAGSVKAQSVYANAIRLGIGTYGVTPLMPKDAKAPQLAGLQPVLTLTSTIIKVVDLKKGDAVSYNGTFVAPRAMKIGVLPLGYYEGIPRAVSNVGCVTYGRRVLPIVGRVCMNHTMIDLKDTKLQVGDKVTVISNDLSQPNSVAQLQAVHGLFPYTTLTGLSSSVRRNIV